MLTFTKQNSVTSVKRQVYAGNKSTYEETLDAAATLTQDLGTSPEPQTGLTATFALTIAVQTNRVLLVEITGDPGATDLVSSVAWNGDALTRALSVRYSDNVWHSFWYLLAPDTGTHNLVVTNSSSGPVEPDISSWYNARQEAPSVESTATPGGTIYAFQVLGLLSSEAFTGSLRQLSAEEASLNGVQFGLGFSLITELGIDLQEGDRIVVDAVEYLVRGVSDFTARGSVTSYLRAILIKPETQ